MGIKAMKWYPASSSGVFFGCFLGGLVVLRFLARRLASLASTRFERLKAAFNSSRRLWERITRVSVDTSQKRDETD